MFAALQLYLLAFITAVLFAVEVFALVDAVRRPPAAFVSAGKRTKNFWAVLLGVFAVLGFIGLYPPIGGGFLGLWALFVVIPAAIYMTDVRPAVSGYRDRGSSGRW